VQTNFYCIEKTSKHFVLSICLFLCHFFRRTVDCFAYFILNSESFRMEQVYIDSARSPLQEYIIKLNQHCLVQMEDSRYKSGAKLMTSTVYKLSSNSVRLFPLNSNLYLRKDKVLVRNIVYSVICPGDFEYYADKLSFQSTAIPQRGTFEMPFHWKHITSAFFNVDVSVD